MSRQRFIHISGVAEPLKGEIPMIDELEAELDRLRALIAKAAAVVEPLSDRVVPIFPEDRGWSDNDVLELCVEGGGLLARLSVGNFRAVNAILPELWAELEKS